MTASASLRSVPRGPLAAAQLTAAVRDLLMEAMAYYRQLGRDHGLSLLQLMSLRLIEGRGPQRPSQLAERFGVSRPAVSEAINSLERGGWVRRARTTANRRTLTATLTPKAVRVMAAMGAKHRAVVDEGVSGTSPAASAELVELLRRIADRYRDRTHGDPVACGGAS